ncbi:MAG: hypothetical protein JW885_15700 [Deltaproteobacteria bacterium]|nr:hypothetical protein [Candidatus Zymogenaceae bacterium]
MGWEVLGVDTFVRPREVWRRFSLDGMGVRFYDGMEGTDRVGDVNLPVKRERVGGGALHHGMS